MKDYQKDPAKIGIVKVIGYLPRPLDDYLRYIKDYEWKADTYDPYDGFPSDKKYDGKFKILPGESEIRLTPDWYNHMEILKKGK